MTDLEKAKQELEDAHKRLITALEAVQQAKRVATAARGDHAVAQTVYNNEERKAKQL